MNERCELAVSHRGSKFYISLISSYACAFFFGFHLTSIEMIRKHYFLSLDASMLIHFYYLAAITFFVPILSGILRSLVYLSIQRWLLIILLSHCLSFTCYIPSKIAIFYIARILAGFAIGLSTTVVPEYLGQLNPEKRGLLTYLFQTFIITGILVGQIATILAKNRFLVKVYFLGFSLLALIAGILTRFIIIQSRENGSNRDDRMRKTTSDLFRERNSKKSIFIALLIHIAQQATCINAVLTYSNTLMDQKDVDSSQKRTILMGFFSLIVTCAASFIIEKVGRKILLQASSLLIMLSLWILIQQYNPLAALLLFQFGFSFGLGPITWLLTNEIFPQVYQSVATPLCGTINWLLATVTVLFFEKWINLYGVEIIYGNIAVLFMISCILQYLLVETRGQSAKFQ